MKQRKLLVGDDGVRIRLSEARPLWRRFAMLGGCTIMFLSMVAATCWQWNGARSRELTLEQAVQAAINGQPDATRAIYLRLVQAREALARIAERPDDVGARARLWLELAERPR